jgi:hypothetical protein
MSLRKPPARAVPLVLRDSWVPEDPAARRSDSWDGLRPAPSARLHRHFTLGAGGARAPFSLPGVVQAREAPEEFERASKMSKASVAAYVLRYGDFRAGATQTLFMQAAAARGHRVLHTPKLHRELAPVELVWAHYVASLHQSGSHGTLRDLLPGLVQLLS